MSNTLTIIVIASFGFLATPAHAQHVYRLTDLGVLPGGSESAAFDINDVGQVVGWSGHLGDGTAFFWSAAEGMTDLGTLPGDRASGAGGVNNFGHVVGWSYSLSGLDDHPFFWSAASGMRNLGHLPGASFSAAIGINDRDEIVGYSGPSNSSLGLRATGWTAEGNGFDLGVLPGGSGSLALAINNSTQIAGVGHIADGSQRATRWNDEGEVLSLGVLPGHEESAARGINDAGDIVGQSGGRAFLWTSGQGMKDLGLLQDANFSAAHAINDERYVVGASGSGDTRAFLWTSDLGMRDLNGMLDASGKGWTLHEANAINYAGQIVGNGVNGSGQARAFLLTPIVLPPLVAFTRFSEPPLAAGTYTPDADGNEIGFATVSAASGGAGPIAGVFSLAGENMLSHRSVRATTTFDDILLSGVDNAMISLYMQVADTSYEAGDFVRAYVTNDAESIDLFNLLGAAGNDPLDALAGEGIRRYSAAIPDNWTKATLVITSSSNSSQAAERYDFDNVEFRGVPEPSTMGLLAAALAVFALRFRNSARAAGLAAISDCYTGRAHWLQLTRRRVNCGHHSGVS